MGRGFNMDDLFLCGYNSFSTTTHTYASITGAAAATALEQIASVAVTSWKANFIRISLYLDSPQDNEVISWPNNTVSYATQMTSVIDAITANPNVYVLVTLRSDTSMSECGDEATGLPTSATDSTYVALVRAFANVPNVMFGLSNEPGCGSVQNSAIEAAMDHAVQTIRTEENALNVPHHLISVQGNDWNSNLAFYLAGANPIPAADSSNVVYEIHYYPASGNSAYVPSAYNALWNTLPVIIGEYGPTSTSGTMETSSEPSFYADMESHQIPNLAWDFEPYSSCAPDLLNVNDSSTQLSPTAWGSSVQAYLASPSSYGTASATPASTPTPTPTSTTTSSSGPVTSSLLVYGDALSGQYAAGWSSFSWSLCSSISTTLDTETVLSYDLSCDSAYGGGGSVGTSTLLTNAKTLDFDISFAQGSSASQIELGFNGVQNANYSNVALSTLSSTVSPALLTGFVHYKVSLTPLLNGNALNQIYFMNSSGSPKFYVDNVAIGLGGTTGSSSSPTTTSTPTPAPSATATPPPSPAPSSSPTSAPTSTATPIPTPSATSTSTSVAGCSGTVGTWQSITPPQLNMSNWCGVNFTTCNVGTNPSGQIGTYGTTDFLIDPTNSGTVYLGTSQLGIWKTTNCGSTWVHINTGNSGTDVNGGTVDGSVMDGGRQWTMLMDSTTNQPILYATAGYGAGGIYKSIDGGVDWSQILPNSIMNMNQYAGFIEKITMDPTNHLHLLASFHTICTGTALPGAPLADNSGNVSVVSTVNSTPTGSGTNYQGWGCMAQTTDGGNTWSMTTSAYPWVNSDGPGQTMVNATTWFYGTNSTNGLWRTTTGGVSVNGAPAWTEVKLYTTGGVTQPLTYAIGSVYVAKDGSFYSGGNAAIVHSTDGVNWTQLSGEYSPALGSQNGSSPIVDTGTTVYVTGSGSNWSAPVSTVDAYTSTNPTNSMFTQLSSPSGAANGLWMKYDSVNQLLYTSNNLGGLWRMKTQ